MISNGSLKTRVMNTRINYILKYIRIENCTICDERDATLVNKRLAHYIKKSFKELCVCRSMIYATFFDNYGAIKFFLRALLTYYY